MKAKLLFLFITCTLIGACKKNSGNSKPDIELKKVDVRNVIAGGVTGLLIDIDVEVKDKEGDVRDSIFIIKQDAATPSCSGNTIDLSKNIPVYPAINKNSVLLNIKFSSQVQVNGYVALGGSSCLGRKDTSRFIIWVKDNAGNRSDTVVTDRIAL
jgi:hypothetical protein